ncbi:LOW QUALITY PROTEIN: guanine nucleotide-binding protein-like 3-like protein, partial [Leucoraja erinacea]|uniref:LOW QUALITY PROTEIN: guanine nucleotide-binding protein-like 3-like protein n=1 Tax=Leucoraja erinaceus TaxID=7782 RepID=UPI00245669B8
LPPPRSRQQMEERRERQRAARDRVITDRRSLEHLRLDAQKRQQEFEQKESKLENLKTNLNLETENSRKAYYREFKKVRLSLEASDVVLEVLDCRDPLGCRCPEVEKEVVEAGTNKRLILVLNKIDLVAKDVVQKWLKYLRNELPTVAFKASTQLQNKHLHRSRVPVERAGEDLLRGGGCVGADNLLRLLGSYCRNQGLPLPPSRSPLWRVTQTVTQTLPTPRCLQLIHLDKHVKLLDCPGIVMASSAHSDAAVVLRNCVKVERLADPVAPVAAILRRCNTEQVRQHYGIGEFRTRWEVGALLERRFGGLKKGGVPDQEKGARTVLTERTW